MRYRIRAALMLAGTLITAPGTARADTFLFEWGGVAGYFVRGRFAFDGAIAPPQFTEQGSGLTSVLKSLDVVFFDPDSTPISSVALVTDGVSAYDFLDFGFDTEAEELFGPLDIGGDDIALVSPNGSIFALFGLNASGQGQIIDFAFAPPQITAVPEPGTMALFAGFGLMGAAFAARERLRWRSLASVLLLLGPCAAQAQRVSGVIQGRVTRVLGAMPGVVIGDLFTGSYSYDTSVEEGFRNPFTDFRLKIGRNPRVFTFADLDSSFVSPGRDTLNSTPTQDSLRFLFTQESLREFSGLSGIHGQGILGTLVQDYFIVRGNDFVRAQFTATPVPEPGVALWLLSAAVPATCLLRARQRASEKKGTR